MAERQESRPARRMPDLLCLIVGLVSLGIAGSGFLGHTPDLSGFDLRWVLAGGAVLLGVVLLAASVRKR
ncbi:hypothetical protein GCM10009836_68370 [Pseudonocardia ailaonensis]|uniref:Uncharacterized protein n=1 Tax=Pseudonocardia ailaonensis TaxID=367279 RepID=A0ABN2NP19_9PSEU